MMMPFLSVIWCRLLAVISLPDKSSFMNIPLRCCWCSSQLLYNILTGKVVYLYYSRLYSVCTPSTQTAAGSLVQLYPTVHLKTIYYHLANYNIGMVLFDTEN